MLIGPPPSDSQKGAHQPQKETCHHSKHSVLYVKLMDLRLVEHIDKDSGSENHHDNVLDKGDFSLVRKT